MRNFDLEKILIDALAAYIRTLDGEARHEIINKIAKESTPWFVPREGEEGWGNGGYVDAKIVSVCMDPLIYKSKY